jgi:hypothetical protein
MPLSSLQINILRLLAKTETRAIPSLLWKHVLEI